MDLIKWSPLRDIDDLFDRYRKGYFGQLPVADDTPWRPAANIVEKDDLYLIKADLPEVAKKDIDVQIEHGVLTISGERRDETRSDDDKQHRRETFYGKFTRSFTLPDDVDENAIKADAKDGVLRVTLPKTKAQKKSSVSIKID
jgi:HSP20 family protein